MLFDPESVRQVLGAVLAAFAMLGGVMAYKTGLAAVIADTNKESLSETAQRMNEGVADGFRAGVQFSMITVILVVWTSWGA